ncbi:MAG: hypothetical protein ABSB59_34820 [Streptosporangiaceae bacterium]
MAIFLTAVSGAGVTACSASTTAATHPTATRSAQLSQSTQLSQSGQVSLSGQLTGTQLADALLPAAAFPRGFRIDQPAAFDSGNRLETGPAKHHPDSMSCADLARYYTRTGFGESALATDDYSTHPGNYNSRHGAIFAQTVYQFANERAAKAFWRGLRVLTARCPGWAIPPLRVTSSRIFAVRYPGALAFQMNSTVVDEKVGTIRLRSLVVVVDEDVFDIDASAIGRSIPARPSLRTMLLELTSRLQGR